MNRLAPAHATSAYRPEAPVVVVVVEKLGGSWRVRARAGRPEDQGGREVEVEVEASLAMIMMGSRVELLGSWLTCLIVCTGTDTHISTMLHYHDFEPMNHA